MQAFKLNFRFPFVEQLKTKRSIYSLIILLFFLATSCKPTEKGYKAAYDAAVGKRESVINDIDASQAISGVQSVDGPQLRMVNGKQYYYMALNLNPLNSEEKITTSGYNIAVAMFKMPTNAKALCQDLMKEGINAYTLKSSEDQFYVIIGNYPQLSDTADCIEQYEKKSDRPFVGLSNNAPVIIYSR